MNLTGEPCRVCGVGAGVENSHFAFQLVLEALYDQRKLASLILGEDEEFVAVFSRARRARLNVVNVNAALLHGVVSV